MLTDKETALSLAIITWLKDEMVTRLENVSPAPDLLCDTAQSNFELGCCALETVGIFKAEADYWRVLPSTDGPFKLPQDFGREGLDELLGALACHSSYTDDIARYDRPIVPRNTAAKDMCLAMIACGYMEGVSETAVEWTDAFGPWLVKNGLWELTDFEAAPASEVEKVLAIIPTKRLEWLSDGLCSWQPDFVRCFFAQYINGEWNDDAWRWHPSDDWDLDLAAGLYLRLHSDRSRTKY